MTVRHWYAVNGTKYLGPFPTRQAAEAAGRAKFADNSGKRLGTVEQLDPEAPRPTFGLHGPLKPRYV